MSVDLALSSITTVVEWNYEKIYVAKWRSEQEGLEKECKKNHAWLIERIEKEKTK